MKNLFFIITLLSSVYSFGQFPPEFPKKLINKVFCGTASTSTPNGSMFGKHFMDFTYRLTIYEDSLFVEYNPGARWKEDKWGRTQTIKEFKEWKREPLYNNYDDLIGHYIHYRIPYGNNNKYSITALKIYVPTEPEEKEKWGNSLNVYVWPDTYQETLLNTYDKVKG